MPSRRHNDPLAPPSRGFPLLRRLTGARAESAPTPTDPWPDHGVSGAVDPAAWSTALEQAGTDPRATPLSAVRMLIEAPTLTGASVPVSVGGAIVGTVCALRRDRYEWTDDDTAVLRVAAERAEQRLAAALRLTGRSALPA